MAGEMKTLNGEQLLVQIETAANSGVFAHDCLINTDRGIQFSADAKEFTVPNCLTPEDPSWVTVIKDGLKAAVNGAGMLHTASVEDWFNWFKGSATKNLRVKINVPGADGGGYWQGAFHLTNFNITGTAKELATSEVTLASSGAVTWVDNT